jgi:hypothetical protein
MSVPLTLDPPADTGVNVGVVPPPAFSNSSTPFYAPEGSVGGGGSTGPTGPTGPAGPTGPSGPSGP